jgi:hypothetical protein
LKKIIIGTVNKQPVICAVKYVYYSCDRTNFIIYPKKSKGQDIAARLFNITAANNSNIVTANGSDNIMIDFDRYLENLPQE